MQQIETNSQAIKDAHAATRQARTERDALKSELSQQHLDTDRHTRGLKAISILESISLELLNELMIYREKHGDNDRVKSSLSRILQYDTALGELSTIQYENYRSAITIQSLSEKLHLANCKVLDLKRQLQLHTANL